MTRSRASNTVLAHIIMPMTSCTSAPSKMQCWSVTSKGALWTVTASNTTGTLHGTSATSSVAIPMGMARPTMPMAQCTKALSEMAPTVDTARRVRCVALCTWVITRTACRTERALGPLPVALGSSARLKIHSLMAQSSITKRVAPWCLKEPWRSTVRVTLDSMGTAGALIPMASSSGISRAGISSMGRRITSLATTTPAHSERDYAMATASMS
mmetsp:Transcript_77183/g.236163  ORF Transcript_77183/g.236163 Transcript_77183/m.236163 type:complete len:213 (+) Transcript_77183:647-1285(+)